MYARPTVLQQSTGDRTFKFTNIFLFDVLTVMSYRVHGYCTAMKVQNGARLERHCDILPTRDTGSLFYLT